MSPKAGDTPIYRWRCGCIESYTPPVVLWPPDEPLELLSDSNCPEHYFAPEPCPDSEAHKQGRCKPVQVVVPGV